MTGYLRLRRGLFSFAELGSLVLIPPKSIPMRAAMRHGPMEFPRSPRWWF